MTQYCLLYANNVNIVKVVICYYIDIIIIKLYCQGYTNNVFYTVSFHNLKSSNLKSSSKFQADSVMYCIRSIKNVLCTITYCIRSIKLYGIVYDNVFS